MPKPYSQLSETSKEKLSNVLERCHKRGITVKEALKMSNSELRQNFNIKSRKKATIDGFKRNLRQLQFTQERQEKVSDRALKTYVKQNYRGKGLNRVKTQLRKHVGLNTFFDIAKKVQTTFNISRNESYNKTRSILNRYRISKSRLSRREIEILSFFS